MVVLPWILFSLILLSLLAIFDTVDYFLSLAFIPSTFGIPSTSVIKFFLSNFCWLNSPLPKLQYWSFSVPPIGDLGILPSSLDNPYIGDLIQTNGCHNMLETFIFIFPVQSPVLNFLTDQTTYLRAPLGWWKDFQIYYVWNWTTFVLCADLPPLLKVLFSAKDTILYPHSPTYNSCQALGNNLDSSLSF